MGESNAVLGREMGPIDRDVLLGCQPVYKELHGEGQEGIPATFRMIYLIGWKEGPNQSKPLERGSGTVSMKDILEGKVEIK
jgi:NADH dehydrogenase [ubiquinone] 1 alpha subcomplex assembly factor 5